ncbi:MAG: Dyp-type peroxidase domain-containing protein, partial [Antricoccus sp.]
MWVRRPKQSGVAGGAAAGGIGGFQIAHGDQPTAATTDRVPFYGSNQAGITTTVQDQLMFAALDITSTDPVELQHLFGTWAAMAARFCEGATVSDGADPIAKPPIDTGEAIDLPASN